jgi:hypothetical protein
MVNMVMKENMVTKTTMVAMLTQWSSSWIMRTDGRMDRQTDRHSKPYMRSFHALCAKNAWS